MKANLIHLICLLNALLALCIEARAQGPAFTYQGRLVNGGTPYSGSAEFQATLWNAASGGTALASNNPVQVIVGVTNGLFVLPLNFGANFPGGGRWLELEVRTTIGAFNVLAPRQQLTPTPYAITASNLSGTLPAAQVSGVLPSANLGGIYNGVVTFNNAGNSFTGHGGGLTNLNASQLGSGTVPDARLSANVSLLGSSITSAEITDGTIAAADVNAASFDTTFWRTTGNAGTTPGTHFLGTTDNQPLEIKVNGRRALRIEPTTNSFFGYSPNFVGGSPDNIVSNGFVGAVIGGGGYSNAPNRAGDHFATVVGGAGNTASGSAATAMGNNTTASGYGSTAMGSATTAGGAYSVAMGESTTASGFLSTAMGFRAKALHDGSFVWADFQVPDFASTGNNQFCVRASGGVRLNSDTSIFFGTTARQMLNLWGTDHAIGVQSATTYFRTSAGGAAFAWFAGGVHHDAAYNPGAGGAELMRLNGGGLTVKGTFVSGSDRNVKENFAPVQPREMLAKVVALPLSSWNYKADTTTRHVGPMAQDFYAAFNFGPDDKHIATVDADGVALAAIQGLNQKVEETRAENAELRRELSEIKRLLRNLSDQKD